MIANPDIPYPGDVPHRFTLNDLRVHDTFEVGPSSTSTLTVAGLVLAAVLAIGAFIWVDPLRLFTSTEASPPAPASVLSAAPERPTETPEIVAPLTPAPATKSLDVPVTQAPVVRAPQSPAPAVQARAASIKPESRGNQTDKANTMVAQARPKEKTAPPVPLTRPDARTAPSAALAEPEKTAPPALLTKPEEKTDAPIVPRLGDDAKTAPKPAATSDQTPASDEAK